MRHRTSTSSRVAISIRSSALPMRYRGETRDRSDEQLAVARPASIHRVWEQRVSVPAERAAVMLWLGITTKSASSVSAPVD
jgi:hypothetical protein